MSELTRPAADGYAVTPGTDPLPNGTCRALWIGGAGDVEVRFPGNATAVVMAGVAAGTLLPVQASHVLSANTDATDIVALY